VKHIVLSDDVSAVVAEDWKVETVLFHESFVRPWIIHVNPNNLSVELVELGETVSKCTHFPGANAGESARKEREQSCALRFQEFLEAVLFSVRVG